MLQRGVRPGALERLPRVVAKGPSRRRQDETANLRARPLVQALVDGVVLTVDRQNGNTPPAGGRGHERAGHDEHLLIGDRNRFLRLDRRQDGFEPGGPCRRADDDVRRRMRWQPRQGLPHRHRQRRANSLRTPIGAGRCSRRRPWRRRRDGTARPAPPAARHCRLPPARQPSGGSDGHRPRRGRCGRSIRWSRGWRHSSRQLCRYT